MGNRGARKTTEAATTATEMLETLRPVGAVTSHSMFGGFGLFESGTMFALVDPGGRLFFRVDSTTQERYENAGSQKHNPMPYFEVPVDVLDDDSQLFEWARQAAQVAHAAKSKR